MNTIDRQPDASQPSLIGTLLRVALHGAAWAVLIFFLLFSVPPYEKLFADFQLKVSDTTSAVIGASRWMNRYAYVLIAPVVLFLALDGAVIAFLQRGRRRHLLSWLWFVLMLGLPLALLAGSWLTLWESHAQLVGGLGAHQ